MMLLSIHLGTNYAAVRAVSLRSLNRQRANMVMSNLVQTGRVLTPGQVSKRERIFEGDGVLRWTDGGIVGHCRIGVRVEDMIRQMGRGHKRSGSVHLQGIKLSELVRLYQDEGYLLWSCGSDAVIVLKQGCSPRDQLKAWTQALLVAHRRALGGGERKDVDVEELSTRLDEANKLVSRHYSSLVSGGWDLSVAALETRAGVRIQVETD